MNGKVCILALAAYLFFEEVRLLRNYNDYILDLETCGDRGVELTERNKAALRLRQKIIITAVGVGEQRFLFKALTMF